MMARTVLPGTWFRAVVIHTNMSRHGRMMLRAVYRYTRPHATFAVKYHNRYLRPPIELNTPHAPNERVFGFCTAA